MIQHAHYPIQIDYLVEIFLLIEVIFDKLFARGRGLLIIKSKEKILEACYNNIGNP